MFFSSLWSNFFRTQRIFFQTINLGDETKAIFCCLCRHKSKDNEIQLVKCECNRIAAWNSQRESARLLQLNFCCWLRVAKLFTSWSDFSSKVSTQHELFGDVEWNSIPFQLIEEKLIALKFKFIGKSFERESWLFFQLRRFSMTTNSFSISSGEPHSSGCKSQIN